MEINSDFIRGHIDTIILSLLREEDMYGYDISKVIYKRTEGYEIKETTLYSSLRRLEKQNVVESYYSTNTNGGSKRKYYHLGLLGKEIYDMYCQEWAKTKKIVDIFTGGKHE
jgi:PadR family transcriptional regulator PadR